MTGAAGAALADDALSGLARTATAALGELVTHDGRLADAGTRDGWSPTDHYGHLGTALALYLTDPRDARVARLLDYWLALPAMQRGHGPFNRLLGHCLLDAARRAQDDAIAARAMRVPAAAPLCRHYPSNNWQVLAQLCRLLDSKSAADRERASRELARLYRRWMTGAGAFVDFPARTYRPGEGATPICYHYKALFVATVALVRTGHSDLAAIVEQLLAWAFMACDDEGYAGGFGRSTHALFGDACLLFSLRALAPMADRPAVMEEAEAVLVQRLRRQQETDGLLALNPAGTAGWDGYMHRTVYNAWAAALLAWAPVATTGSTAPAGRARVRVLHSPEDDTDAGLHRIEAPGTGVLLLSSRGQPAQSLGRTEVELRYAGGIPFHLTLGGVPRIAPPTREPIGRLLEEPASAGWVPLLLQKGAVFIAAYDRVQRHADSGGTRLAMNGHPVPATQPLPRGITARALQALDWRLLDGRLARRASVKRPRLPRVHVDVTLAYNPAMKTLEQTLRIRNDSTTALQLLNPGGHALLAAPGDVEVTFESDRDEGPRQWRVTALEASLPGATGYCLEPVVIGAGASYAQRLTIRWRS